MVAAHHDGRDHQPAAGSPVHRQEGVERRRPHPAERRAELCGPLVLAASAWVHQLGLEGPAGRREVELGAGHRHVPEPHQGDGHPADGVVGGQGDQAGDHEEHRRDADRPQRGRHVLDAAGRRHRQEDAHHGVGAEQEGQQHARGVGLLDQPQRDDDVEQHLVGPQHPAEERRHHPAEVAQRPGPGSFSLRSSGVRSSWEALGSRRIAAALTRNTTAVNHGQGLEHHVGLEGQGDAAEQRAEGEADVERGVHVGPRLHPLVRREHVDRVGAVGGAAQGADDLHGDRHRDVAAEAVDERPHREQAGLAGRAQRPHPLGPVAVDHLARRQRGDERRDAGDGQPEPDLRGAQADDLGEEHRGAGHEGALAEGEQQRLGRQSSGQRGGRAGTADETAAEELMTGECFTRRRRRRPNSRSEPAQEPQSSVAALSSTTRRICSISSKWDWSQISGGASWTTGSPRSSARQ